MNDFAAAKEAFNEYRHAVEEFKQTNDQKIAELKGSKSVDTVTKEKLDRLGSVVDDLQTKFSQTSKKLQRPQLTSTSSPVKQDGHYCAGNCSHSDCILKKNDLQYKEYCRAFSSYLRWAADRHGEGLHENYRKALNFGTDNNGGYWFPDTMEQTIDEAINELSPLRKYCSMVRISSEYFSYPQQGALSAQWRNSPIKLGSTELEPEANRITVHEQYTAPKISQNVLQDSHFNVEQWLANCIAESFANSEAESFISGSGTGMPTGILSAPKTKLTPNLGKSQKVAAFISKHISDDSSTTIETLYELVYAMESVYRKDATWLMNRKTAHKMRQLKDGDGNYLWAPSVNPYQDNYFLGYKVLENDRVSDINSDGIAFVFTNLKHAYLIVDHSMSMIRDPYTYKPWVLFYTMRKIGGGIINANAIKFLVTPATAR